MIGLLDTGADVGHPDLKDKVAHWAEFDSLGIPISSQPHDSDEHGTHCAGTLVGGNASGRHIGLAPGAKLAAAMVLHGEEGGTDAQVLAGIDWCVEQKVDVISLSLGGLFMDAETPPTYTEAILTCLEAGIPVVAAIGNEGEQTTGSPGNDLFAISVGATDPQDRVAGFSGGRTQILRKSDFIEPKYLPLPYSKPELSAPGVAISRSVPGGKWKAFNGTSMATPHVAGGIALLLGTDENSRTGDRGSPGLPDQGPDAWLRGRAGRVRGQDHRYGFGRLERILVQSTLPWSEAMANLPRSREAPDPQRAGPGPRRRAPGLGEGQGRRRRELIVGASVPKRTVSLEKRGSGRVLPREVKSEAGSDRATVLSQLQRDLDELLGTSTNLLRSAGAIAVKADRQQLCAIARHPLVRAVRPNRRLKLGDAGGDPR